MPKFPAYQGTLTPDAEGGFIPHNPAADAAMGPDSPVADLEAIYQARQARLARFKAEEDFENFQRRNAQKNADLLVKSGRGAQGYAAKVADSYIKDVKAAARKLPAERRAVFMESADLYGPELFRRAAKAEVENRHLYFAERVDADLQQAKQAVRGNPAFLSDILSEFDERLDKTDLPLDLKEMLGQKAGTELLETSILTKIEDNEDYRKYVLRWADVITLGVQDGLHEGTDSPAEGRQQEKEEEGTDSAPAPDDPASPPSGQDGAFAPGFEDISAEVLEDLFLLQPEKRQEFIILARNLQANYIVRESVAHARHYDDLKRQIDKFELLEPDLIEQNAILKPEEKEELIAHQADMAQMWLRIQATQERLEQDTGKAKRDIFNLEDEEDRRRFDELYHWIAADRDLLSDTELQTYVRTLAADYGAVPKGVMVSLLDAFQNPETLLAALRLAHDLESKAPEAFMHDDVGLQVAEAALFYADQHTRLRKPEAIINSYYGR